MDNDELIHAEKPALRHAVDLEKLKRDTGLSIRDIASAVGMKEQRNIYKWAYSDGGTRPSYDTIIKLIELGASPEAVFGIQWPAAERNDSSVIASSEDFKAGVREALAEILRIKDGLK